MLGWLLSAGLRGVGIHHRPTLGRLGGFRADIWHRGVIRCRLDRPRFEIDRTTRPAEIVGPPAPRRDGDRADDSCVGGGSDDDAAKQFFRSNARDRERHDRSRCRPLSRSIRLGFWHLRGRINRDRQRNWETLVADDALDFSLHIVRKLARAELGE